MIKASEEAHELDQGKRYDMHSFETRQEFWAKSIYDERLAKQSLEAKQDKRSFTFTGSFIGNQSSNFVFGEQSTPTTNNVESSGKSTSKTSSPKVASKPEESLDVDEPPLVDDASNVSFSTPRRVVFSPDSKKHDGKAIYGLMQTDDLDEAKKIGFQALEENASLRTKCFNLRKDLKQSQHTEERLRSERKKARNNETRLRTERNEARGHVERLRAERNHFRKQLSEMHWERHQEQQGGSFSDFYSEYYSPMDSSVTPDSTWRRRNKRARHH